MKATHPIRVLQFGTGVLLRGLCDEIIDRAIIDDDHPWDGAIAVVQSTGTSRIDALREAGNRYSVITRGLTADGPVDESRPVASIAEALAADRDWDRVREIACSVALDVVLSNTTEAGLRPSPEDRAVDEIPRSYPAKLLRVLLERFAAGLPAPVVIPCELVDNNGQVLRDSVLELARRFGVSSEELSWIENEVPFASSLVDRICTRPDGVDESDLTVVIEPFAQWVIQIDRKYRPRLSFADGVAGAQLVDDVGPYFTRKVRVLNGAHTSVVHMGLLVGMSTVRELCEDPHFAAFLSFLLEREILPPLVAQRIPGVREFASDVVKRFANPFAVHRLADIAVGTEAKVQVRIVPTLCEHSVPTPCLCLGIAAWLQHEQRGAPEEWPAQIRGVVADWAEVLSARGPRESMRLAMSHAIPTG